MCSLAQPPHVRHSSADMKVGGAREVERAKVPSAAERVSPQHRRLDRGTPICAERQANSWSAARLPAETNGSAPSVSLGRSSRTTSSRAGNGRASRPTIASEHASAPATARRGPSAPRRKPYCARRVDGSSAFKTPTRRKLSLRVGTEQLRRPAVPTACARGPTSRDCLNTPRWRGEARACPLLVSQPFRVHAYSCEAWLSGVARWSSALGRLRPRCARRRARSGDSRPDATTTWTHHTSCASTRPRCHTRSTTSQASARGER